LYWFETLFLVRYTHFYPSPEWVKRSDLTILYMEAKVYPLI